MNQVMIDLWPYLIVPLIGAIGWLFREVYLLKTKVEVTEKNIAAMKEVMKTNIDNIQKIIESVQKRQDSHSKKQDDILEKLSSIEREFLKQMGTMSANFGSLASDVKGLSNLLAVSDYGIKITK